MWPRSRKPKNESPVTRTLRAKPAETSFDTVDFPAPGGPVMISNSPRSVSGSSPVRVGWAGELVEAAPRRSAAAGTDRVQVEDAHVERVAPLQRRPQRA